MHHYYGSLPQQSENNTGEQTRCRLDTFNPTFPDQWSKCKETGQVNIYHLFVSYIVSARFMSCCLRTNRRQITRKTNMCLSKVLGWRVPPKLLPCTYNRHVSGLHHSSNRYSLTDGAEHCLNLPGVRLADLGTVKVKAFGLHPFPTHQTNQWPLVSCKRGLCDPVSPPFYSGFSCSLSRNEKNNMVHIDILNTISMLCKLH